jgi:hypothetical protein
MRDRRFLLELFDGAHRVTSSGIDTDDDAQRRQLS